MPVVITVWVVWVDGDLTKLLGTLANIHAFVCETIVIAWIETETNRMWLNLIQEDYWNMYHSFEIKYVVFSM